MTTTTARRSGRVITLLCGLAVVVGLGLVLQGVAGQDDPPVAPAALGTIDASPSGSSSPPDDTLTPSESPWGTASPRPGTSTGTDTARADARDNRQARRTGVVVPLSPPVRLQIPALGVDTDVNSIGKNADGTLAVPQPGPLLDEAAWFDESVSPGQDGPAVIEGHVDSEQGPSVFYELAALRPGDEVVVTRADGMRATFTVDALRDVRKSEFPTELVYGGTDLSQPTLRLITCSQFDPAIGTHVGNTLVFAGLSDLEQT